VFPVRYELNLYILFRRNSVFKGLIEHHATNTNGAEKVLSEIPGQGSSPNLKTADVIMRCLIRAIAHLRWVWSNGGMMINREKPTKLGKKPAPMSLHPPRS
jgi:hypothetical protein